MLIQARMEMYASKRTRDVSSGSEAQCGPAGNEEEMEEKIINKWRITWDTTTKGRWTYACIPSIKMWLGSHGDTRLTRGH